MANIKSAEKRNRQNEKNRKKNVRVKSTIKTATKKVVVASQEKEKNTETIKGFFKNFTSTVDSACRKGVIHWKTAARKKSRMAKKVNAATK
ncbi:MAG: 30S ribosomal protein S20 [Spirochaetota bacterium]